MDGQLAMARHFSRRLKLILLLACVQALVFARAAEAQWREGFEANQSSWQPAESDVGYQLERRERVHQDMHSGSGAEYLQVNGQGGSYIFFAHPVPAAQVVSELIPSVWIRANRPGLQILARVVLPNSTDPRTGAPISTYVRGTSYSAVGNWQQLRITDLPQLLNRQVRVLRAEIGPQVDPREAYIDQVVLNVYGGPGQTALVVDDLELAGMVPRAALSSAPPPTIQQVAATAEDNIVRPSNASMNGASDRSTSVAGSNGSPARQVALSGTLLTVDGRPMMPRIIQSQGESLEWLMSEGFNTVRSTGPISPEMLAEAKRLGIWLIGPPPQDRSAGSGDALKIGEIDSSYEPVLAWHLGSGLAARELPATTALAKQVRAADRLLRRPLVASIEEETFAYSRQLDALSVYRAPLATTLDLKAYGSWLRERPRLARPGTPFWTVVQTEPSPQLAQQDSAITGSPSIEPSVDPESLRLLVYHALASGIRGIEFASSARLDANDERSRIRAITLALLNLELELMEPWGAAGSIAGSATCADPNVRSVVLSTETARLIVAMRSQSGSQFIAAPQQLSSTLVVPGVPESSRVYELTPLGIRPLESKRVAGGVSVSVEDFALTAAVLITSDPVVTAAMSRRAAQMAPRAAQLQRDLAIAMLSSLEATARRITNAPDLPPFSAKLAETRAAIAQANTLLASGDYSRAYLAARNALVPIGRWKHEAWTRMVKGVNSAATSPLAASFDTMPEHLQFVAAVGAEAVAPPAGQARDVQPSTPNLLVGGDFENLQQMIDAGWRHFEHAQPNVQTAVELSPQAPYEGRFCLKLSAKPAKPEAAATLVESTPLWITSSPVHLESGDIVCIRGRVRIAKPITASIDGLMIIDSLGGEPLAERLNQIGGWKPFVLYRAAPYSTDMTVTLALTGLGDVDIDDVSIRLVRRGGAYLKSNVVSDRLLNGAIGAPAAAPGTMLNSWIAPPGTATQAPTGPILSGQLNPDATTKR